MRYIKAFVGGWGGESLIDTPAAELVNDVSKTRSDSDQFFCCVRESASLTRICHEGNSMLGLFRDPTMYVC
jgi:hypothetical protein